MQPLHKKGTEVELVDSHMQVPGSRGDLQPKPGTAHYSPGDERSERLYFIRMLRKAGFHWSASSHHSVVWKQCTAKRKALQRNRKLQRGSFGLIFPWVTCTINIGKGKPTTWETLIILPTSYWGSLHTTWGRGHTGPSFQQLLPCHSQAHWQPIAIRTVCNKSLVNEKRTNVQTQLICKMFT